MRVYKISMDGDFGAFDGISEWASSMREAKASAKSIEESCSDPLARAGARITPIDFTPTRAGILEMLNKHAWRG